jgi:hypothetical protein
VARLPLLFSHLFGSPCLFEKKAENSEGESTQEINSYLAFKIVVFVINKQKSNYFTIAQKFLKNISCFFHLFVRNINN